MKATKNQQPDQLKPLIQILNKISRLESIENLLNWDLETYLPPGAVNPRSEQCALIADILHQQYTTPKLGKLLSKFMDTTTGILHQPLPAPQNQLIKLTWRIWREQNCLPASFVQQFSKLKAQAHAAWEKARTQNNFNLFAPYLAELITLNKQKADYLGWQQTRYDALLDLFEPGLTVKQIDPLFQNLGQDLSQLLLKVQQNQKPKINLSDKAFSIPKQEKFTQILLKAMGFNLKYGRIDISTHPFTTQLHPHDVRLTTNYKPHNLLDAILSTMHEAGHGLYEQNLNLTWQGTPMGQAASFGLHESQSRLWENLVGKSYAFWQHYYPKLQRLFPKQLAAISLDDFYLAINQVTPSLIRIEADELTYNLHIIIRYEIEKQLINGHVNIQDLPQRWNQLYQQYLQVTPQNLKEGVLQDVHWALGYFGYFPSYTLGNLYSVQLFEQAQTEIPNLKTLISQGKLLPLTKWLNTKIHQQSSLKSTQEIIQQVTGQTLNTKPFLNYLKNKYL